MAQKAIITYTDDYTGEPVDMGELITLRFAAGGSAYEMDASPETEKLFTELIGPWIDKARRVSTITRRPQRRSVEGRQAAADMRAWAVQHAALLETEGLAPISERGRIPAAVSELRKRYEAGEVQDPPAKRARKPAATPAE